MKKVLSVKHFIAIKKKNNSKIFNVFKKKKKVKKNDKVTTYFSTKK